MRHSGIPRDSSRAGPDTPGMAHPPRRGASPTHLAIHHHIEADPVGFKQRAELHAGCVSVVLGKPGGTRLSLPGPSAALEIYKSTYPGTLALSNPRQDWRPSCLCDIKGSFRSSKFLPDSPQRVKAVPPLLDQPGATRH